MALVEDLSCSSITQVLASPSASSSLRFAAPDAAVPDRGVLWPLLAAMFQIKSLLGTR